MSKPVSYYYVGTQGFLAFYGPELSLFRLSSEDAESIIAARTKGLDLREHSINNKKALSSKQMKEVKQKIAQRTATMEEYKNYAMTQRFNKRRQQAIDTFWKDERDRILSGKPWTRQWTEEQKETILAKRRPKFNGKTLQGHHTYSVSKYPHLSNRSEVIYPVTFDEHLYEWHGGNFKNSSPGKRIKKKKH